MIQVNFDRLPGEQVISYSIGHLERGCSGNLFQVVNQSEITVYRQVLAMNKIVFAIKNPDVDLTGTFASNGQEVFTFFRNFCNVHVLHNGIDPVVHRLNLFTVFVCNGEGVSPEVHSLEVYGTDETSDALNSFPKHDVAI